MSKYTESLIKRKEKNIRWIMENVLGFAYPKKISIK